MVLFYQNGEQGAALWGGASCGFDKRYRRVALGASSDRFYSTQTYPVCGNRPSYHILRNASGGVVWDMFNKVEHGAIVTVTSRDASVLCQVGARCQHMLFQVVGGA